MNPVSHLATLAPPSSAWVANPVLKYLSVALIVLATGIALAMRLPDLERRPMHTDEAVQAKKTGDLLERNYYRYDPHEFHGPTLYYFTLPVLKLASVKSFADSSEIHYRIVPVLFGAAAILLLFLVLDGIGRTAAVVSALLMAFSPSMVFYSRYYIQEMLLVFLTFALIGCGWRWYFTRAWRWAALAGVCLGLMHATKETFVIAVFAMGAGIAVNAYYLRIGPAERRKAQLRRTRNVEQIVLVVVLAALVSFLFYSSFFKNSHGFRDSYETYFNYLRRSSATNPHDKPWYYYIKLLLWKRAPGAPTWTEALTLALAGVGAVHAFFSGRGGSVENPPLALAPIWIGKQAFERFLAVYAAMMVAGYSVIAYKTPWCVLSMQHAIILLAGCGAAVLLRLARHWALKSGLAALLAAGIAHQGWQAYQAGGRFAYDTRNPYVYAHTSGDAVKLCKRVVELAAVHPDRKGMLVHVFAPESDYWPIPWYLRTLKNVGYTKQPPRELEAPVLVASQDFDAELSLELKRKYQMNSYGLRPGIYGSGDVLMTMYVDAELWKRFMETRATVKPGAPK